MAVLLKLSAQYKALYGSWDIVLRVWKYFKAFFLFLIDKIISVQYLVSVEQEESQPVWSLLIVLSYKPE